MRLSSALSSGTSDSGDMKVDYTRRSERLVKQTAPPVPRMSTRLEQLSTPSPARRSGRIQTQGSSTEKASSPINSHNKKGLKEKSVVEQTPPVPRMSTRLEQQSTPSPARRSGRIQTQGSSAEKASSPINKHNKKGLKEKSVEQLTTEAAEVSPCDTDNSTKRRILNARNYKALFKKQKKLKDGEGKFEQGNQVDSLDNSVSNTQPLEHRENGNLECELKGIEPSLGDSIASSSKEWFGIDVEPEFAYPDQSFSDKPPGSSDVDGSLIGCTNTETVDIVSESLKGKLPLSMSKSSTSKQKGDILLKSGDQVTQLESESCALPLEVDSSRIVANKESSDFGADSLNSNLVKKNESSVAYGSKTDPSKFVEYWVPVPVSNVQLEHYCATLVANTITLCSPLKKDVFGVLPNILNTVHKCCDHPYLMDRSIQPSILKEFTPIDILNVGIKASGKLQLLDMILSRCGRLNHKVLILYQSFAGSGGIGDILDDYIRQKFGEKSYGRLEPSLILSKRQETLNKFNDKGGEQFVLLLEHRACSSSVKLLLVDFVIIFNTELSRPANEVRDLQRMSIAQSKQIKVFRLYSCHTLEEKVLILAKHHKSVNLQNTNRAMSDSLLMWDASVLFNRLDKFHAEQSTGFSLDCLSGNQSLLDDVVMNIMDKIMNEPVDNCEHGSIISRAFFIEGVYHMETLLLGEKDVQQTDGVDRQLFWKELLEGRKPWWKFWGPTSKSRKRGTYDENSETAKKHQKVVDTRVIVSNIHLAVESGGQDAVPKTDSDQPASENEQTSLHEFMKDEMEKLSLVLQLSMDIKQMIGVFLEYVIKNHQVSKEPASILHAFQISLCWAAAKILKKSMNKRETLMRAKNAFQFQCTEEEAYSVYEKLRALKKTFQQLRIKNSVSLPSQNVSVPQGIRKQTLYEGHPKSAALEEESSSLGLTEELTADELNGSFPDTKIKWLEKQHEKEILDFHKTKEQEKSRLESDHQIESALIRKTYAEDGTSRSMLMQLENELKNNIQEHEDSIEVQFEELQTRHSAEKKKIVDEWRTKEMSCIARSHAGKEVPSASHNTEKRNPNYVVRDNGTDKLTTSGISVTVADNTVDSAACSETSLRTPANYVPDELLRMKRAGAEPAIVVEQPGTQASDCNKLSVANHMHIERTNSLPPAPAASVQMVEGSNPAVSLNENTTGMSSVEDMGASNLCSRIVEQPGTPASDCNKLSVATVNHMHIERTNSLPPTPTASVQMVEGSNPAVSQNENTTGMSSVEDMGASNLCGHQVNERFASPTSAPSQVVEEFMDLSHQETMGQPPSREIVEPTHCDTQFDLVIGTGANDGTSVELPVASQNDLAPIPQVERLTRPPNQFVAQSDLHVHPMHHIGFRNSTLALHPHSLLTELDTIQKMREQIVKLHDGKESLINSEYERKQKELQMQQQEKLKEAKSARMREMAQIERNYKVASMHKTLSEALQFKCSNWTMQQGLAAAVPPHFMQQMHQAVPQPRLSHPSAATLSSTSHPTAGQHISYSPVQSHHRSSTFSASRPTMSLQNLPIQSHHRSSGPFASARPPQISSITPSVGSPRVGGEIRAQAPHLQPYRPPASSALHLPSNIPTQLMTAPPFRPNLPSQSPSMLHLSSLNQDVGSSQLSEMQNGVAHIRLNLSFSAMDLLMDPLRNFAVSASSANASSDPSTSRVPRNVNEDITAASDVVLLSDDES